MRATQTGIPIGRCTTCDRDHPITRTHCIRCGTASAFQTDGVCMRCQLDQEVPHVVQG